MVDVWNALDLSETLAWIVEQISAGTTSRLLVRGPPGTGKTTFCETVAQRFAPELELLRLRGDMGRVKQEYYPFFNLLRARSTLSTPQSLLNAAADDLPAGSNLVRRAIDLVAAFAELRRTGDSPGIHDATGAEIVAVLRGRVQRRKTLLLLDDVHAFDPQTIHVLDLIAAAPRDYLGRHGDRLYILASENADERDRNPDRTRDRLLASFRIVELSRCPRDRFPLLLQAFGFTRELTGAVADDLFRRSGAHLRILAELARHMASSVGSIDLYGRTDLLELVLKLRLAEPDAVDQRVEAILARIAILGTTFTRVEAQCLLEDVTPLEVGGAFRKSMELSLLEGEGPVLSFQHSSIREFFLHSARREQPRYHEIFASCLRILRPSDYASRVLHLRACGHDEEADALQVLQWARASRAGREPGRPVYVLADYADYVADLDVAHRLMDEDRHSEAIGVLKAMHGAYPDLLKAEHDLTLAECYLEEIDYGSFELGLQLLESWYGRLAEEVELRSRMLYLLAVGRALMSRYDEADAMFEELMNTLAPVRHTDPGLQRMLNRVQLVSDCQKAIEVSGRRIHSALTSLRGARQAGRAFNPLDLYVALTNYSGNQIITGEYEMAAAAAAEASQLREEYNEIRFPSAVPALNNHLIADLLGGRTSAADTLPAFRELLSSDELDEVLVSVNYANVLALNGELFKAAELLDTQRNAMRERGACDEYYWFYVDHALAAVLLLAGEYERARHLWGLLVPLFTTLPPGLREFIPQRHMLLTPAFDDPRVIRPEDWHGYLRGSRMVRGRPWRFFQNGFLFTDIQHWFQV